LTGVQAVQRRKHLRDEDHQIVKASAAAVKDNDRNAATAQILLVGHVLVDGDQQVIARLLSGGQEYTVREPF
jgi:hypothetical protein